MARSKDKKNTNSGTPAASSSTPTKSRSRNNTNPSGSRPSSGTAAKPQVEKKASPGSARISSSTVKIIVQLIATLGLIVAAILACPALNAWAQRLPIFSPTPVPPTATPFPFAQIQSLEIRKAGNLIDTLNPRESIDLTTGDNVVAKLIIITNTDLDDLLFSWEFCQQANNAKGQGAMEIPYLVGPAGQDCINVRIEKGGQFLDTARFFVSVNNN